MRLRTLSVLSVLLLSLSFASCASCGRGSEANIAAKTTTLGQELQDLKKAYDDGIITEREYEKKRKELLKE